MLGCGEGLVVVAEFVVFDGDRVTVPARATSDAWWLTLNSIELSIPPVAAGTKHGLWCGAGVRLMLISFQGTRHVRWTKRYFSRYEAKDMCLSARW